MQTSSIAAFVLLAVLSSTFGFKVEKPQRTNKTITLDTLERVGIKVDNGVTDYRVVMHPEFTCPFGYICDITVEVQQMTCTVTPTDVDPSYIWFTPIQTISGFTGFEHEDRTWLCNDYSIPQSPLRKYNLAAILLEVVGNKWKSGEATCQLFVQISATRNDVHNLYVFLVTLFLWLAGVTFIGILGICVLFTYKINQVGERLRARDRVKADRVEVLPPTYLSTWTPSNHEKLPKA